MYSLVYLLVLQFARNLFREGELSIVRLSRERDRRAAAWAARPLAPTPQPHRASRLEPVSNATTRVRRPAHRGPGYRSEGL